MEKIILKEDYIKLGQALKAAGLAGSGAEAKEAILDGLVMVDDTVEYQRGKKLTGGEIITFKGNTIEIEKPFHCHE